MGRFVGPVVVWHVKDLTGPSGRSVQSDWQDGEFELTFPRDFNPVALVDVTEVGPGRNLLEFAFEKTNNIDRPWVENEEVAAFKRGHRSTSVGDVIQDQHGSPWVCSPLGWGSVTPDAPIPTPEVLP